MTQEAQVVKWNCPCGNLIKFHGFTKAPQRTWVGLTDEQIEIFREAHSKGRGAGWSFDFKGFARAIEAKSKEKNYG